MLPILAALLLATAQPGPAEPASDALVDRFMAAIPDAHRLEEVDRTADPAELARLSQLNPGKADAIRPVLETFAACASPFSNAISRDGLRFAAQRLGRAKLERLVAFYEGDDFRRFDALGARLAAGETLSAEDQAELDRITAAYPLEDFNTVMNVDMMDFLATQTEQMREIDRCSEAKDAALAGLDIDTQGPQLEVAPPPNPVPNGGQ